MIKWKRYATNPVFFVGTAEKHNGWYFYDETWAYIHGPYHSQTEAIAQLYDYVEAL